MFCNTRALLLLATLAACSSAPVEESEEDVGALGGEGALPARTYQSANGSLTLSAPDAQGAVEAQFVLTTPRTSLGIRVEPTLHRLETPACRVVIIVDAAAGQAEVRQDPETRCSTFATLDGSYYRSGPNTFAQTARGKYQGVITLAEDGRFDMALYKPETGGTMPLGQGRAVRGFGYVPTARTGCLVSMSITEQEVTARQFGDCGAARGGVRVDGTYRRAEPYGDQISL